MDFESNIVKTLDYSRIAPPSPTGTEHHDDSSRESPLLEENPSQEKIDKKKIDNQSCPLSCRLPLRSVDEHIPAGKGGLQREDSRNATAMPQLPLQDTPGDTKVDGMAGASIDNTTRDDSATSMKGDQEKPMEQQQEAVGDVEENSQEMPSNHQCESSGIDPDGSTDCLDSPQSLPSADSHEDQAKDEEQNEEGQQLDSKGETTEEETHMPQDSTFTDHRSTEASSPAPSGYEKEPRDAPSAASDLDTASESADDKDYPSPESQVVEIETNNDTTEFHASTKSSIDGCKSPALVETVDDETPSESAEVDAAGAIARTNSKPAGIGDHYEDSPNSELEAANATNDSHSSVTSNNSSKRPMDASGRLSVDVEVLQQKSSDPVGDHGKKVVGSTAKESNGEGTAPPQGNAQPSEQMLTSIHEHHKQQLGLPTPREAMDKATSDAALRAATEPPDEVMISDSQVQLGILANKDKEGFGLLARGESFKVSQDQNQHPQSQPNQYDPLHGYRPNDQSHPLHDQDESRRRENGFVSVSRSNSARPEDFQQSLDDNSNRQLDDASWRQSQVSYPSSPQAFTAPQAMPFNNPYMMMPQHQMQQMPQGQPPHAFMAQHPAMLAHQSSFHSQQPQLLARPSYPYAPVPAMQAPMPSPGVPVSGGKRKIKLKLQEEILTRPSHTRRSSFFFARSTRKLMASQTLPENEQVNEVDRGTITVSWFEGTSSLELQEHVNRSVERKLKLDKGHQLDDIRILDTKSDPPEEIVLCPYIPSGSEFVLRYKLKPASGRSSPVFYGPPDSPSAAPSPHPSMGRLGGLDPSQLAKLRKELDSVQEGEQRRTGKYRGKARSRITPMKPFSPDDPSTEGAKKDQLDDKSTHESDGSDGDNDSDTYKPESSVDAKLRQITELLMIDKKAQMQRYPPVAKRQVIFVLANYFVLFVAFITLLAEAQARAPGWLSWMENQLENVQTCSADKDALFKCVSNGEFAGLFATVILWISRSATTKRVFLLGFDSPEKLWIVFYESLVGAFCWGVSYMFIRRGMNPDTRPQFLHKYWKDAVYGSLAGFNATFMKAVLKNLIPREAVEEAFGDRQLKILSWLPSFA